MTGGAETQHVAFAAEFNALGLSETRAGRYGVRSRLIACSGAASVEFVLVSVSMWTLR